MVTGAARGIGLGIAEALARTEGCIVVIADLSEERAAEAASRLRAEGLETDSVAIDVTRAASCRAAVAHVTAGHGRLDVLVNNAGISAYGPSEEFAEEEWDRVVRVLLTGTFLASQAAYPPLREHGGAIVNIGSVGALGGWPLRGAYDAAKAGVVNLTQTLATEWASVGIRVNCVSPGTIRTEMAVEAERQGVASLERYARRTPLGRMGTVAEIGSAVAYLVSERAAFVTGINLRVDGGWAAWLNPRGDGYPAESVG
jgi:NAD(P)-dependent dehydrogenase (short-subunit alcohol dehydrogenase family)